MALLNLLVVLAGPPTTEVELYRHLVYAYIYICMYGMYIYIYICACVVLGQLPPHVSAIVRLKSYGKVDAGVTCSCLPCWAQGDTSIDLS